jgi:non-ribosomal peptide synthetase component F
MTILAGFAALLSRLSGQQDIVIGTPVANRTRTEIEGLIGSFLNMLALRMDLSGDPSVKEFLERVKQGALSALANQNLPFEQVVELIHPARSLAHAPVFQVMFAWQNNEPVNLDLPGLKLAPLDGEQTTSKFDLTLDLAETGDRISGSLVYATALLEPETAERYVGYLLRLLDEMVGREEESLSKLPMMSEAELHQLVVEWNATESEYPADQCIHELFEAQAERTPDATAVVHEDRSMSYGELNAAANRLAHYLINLGVRTDDRIAICMERSLEMIVALLAVLKAGGGYVPLDPAYPAERLAYVLEDSEPLAVLTHGPALSALSAALARQDRSPVVLEVDTAGAWAAQPAANPGHGFGLTARHLAYVIYTSGSTGRPKGVMVEHQSFRNLVHWYVGEFTLSSDDSVLIVASFSFDATQKNILSLLSVGGKVCLAGERFEPKAIIKQLVSRGISMINLTPTAFHLLVDAAGDGELRGLQRVFL